MRVTGKSALAAVVGTTLAMACSATPALAQDFFARGSFNNWETTHPLTALGGGMFQGTVTGLSPNQRVEYKLATSDWATAFPLSNGTARADANGNLTFFLNTNEAGDGWAPTGPRATSSTNVAWEIMGSFSDNWNTPVPLTDLGGGKWSTQLTIPAAGNHEMKFRQVGDWEVNVGGDFGTGGNITFSTAAPDTPMNFQLDIPGGRYLVAPVPEPASLGLGGLAAAAALGRRRRQNA